MDVFDEVDISIIFDLVCREINDLDNHKQGSNKISNYNDQKLTKPRPYVEPQREFDLRTKIRNIKY